MSTLPTLGIDGAIRAGAEVLLGPKGHALAAVVWETTGPKDNRHLEVRVANQGGVMGPFYPTDNLQLALCCHKRLRCYIMAGLQMGIEDVFIGKNPTGAADLLKVDGLLVSPWLRQAGEPTWVPISTWRKTCFPRGWRKMYRHEGDRKGFSQAAKRCSLAVMPALVPGLKKLLAALGQIDHITDAAGVAWHTRQMSLGR